MPLDPWQEWAVIHGGELLPDGIPRFRFLLLLVGRQNGKTLLLRVLILYWMFIERHKEILGTHADRGKAKQSWREVIEMAEGIDLLVQEMPVPHVQWQLSEERFWNCHGSTYRFAAPNRRAGRGSTLSRVVLDELREHRTRDTYNAVVNAGNAVEDFQVWAITNQGDMTSIMLDQLRTSALEFIETGAGDPALFLAEWSAPTGCEITDVDALAMANPNLGRRVQLVALMGQALTAQQAGGQAVNDFRVEVLCQRVTLLDPAIDESAWLGSGTGKPLDLAQHRRRVALCYDVALDLSHATLAAAALVDGVAHVEVIRAWQGAGCTAALRAELPEIVARVRPRRVAWFPGGPAAAVAADLKQRRGRHPWPPRGVKVEELAVELPAVCMGFAEIVGAGQLRHPRDPLLDAHVGRTQKLRRGDVWTFTRSGDLAVDATYAAAGAVHTARAMPPPLKPLADAPAGK